MPYLAFAQGRNYNDRQTGRRARNERIVFSHLRIVFASWMEWHFCGPGVSLVPMQEGAAIFRGLAS
jgi:hypothetical protein